MTTLNNLSKKQKNVIMIGLTLSVLIAALDSTIVSTAMKNISDDLNGFDLYAWPLTIYMLFSTIITPISGKLADTFGRKLFFIIGSFTFLIGSALCGLSQSMLQLIIFRALQGFGGGTLMANTFAMIGDVFPPQERAKNTGIVFSAFGLASIIGPVLGGSIAEHIGWRWVFYINLPVGIIFISLILAAVPSIKKDNSIREKVDYAGTVALILGLAPMLLAISWAGEKYSWLSIQILSMLVFSLIMLIAFVFIESKAKEPILPLSLFQNRTFCVSITSAFLSNATMFGAVLFIPLYAQVILNVSATNSGMVTTPMMISFVIASFLSGQAISKTGKLKFFAVIGFIVTAVGVLILTRLNVKSTLTEAAIAMIVSGLGIGINMPVFTLAVQNVFPQSKMGVVTASVQFFRNIGGTIASAVFGIIMLSSVSNGIEKIKLSKINSSDTTLNFSAIIKNPQALTNTNTLNAFKKQIPPSAMAEFNKLLQQIKDILSIAIHNVFVTSLIIAIAAIAVSLLLPNISVKKEQLQPELNVDKIPKKIE